MPVARKHVLWAALAVAAAIVAGGLVAATLLNRAPATIEIVRVGVLPDEAPAALRERYTPLLTHLARQTGLQYRLTIPETYGDLLAMFADREIDLAYFGGLTFVQASTHHAARPLVMRDVDTRFTSYFVTRADGPLAACPDLACPALRGTVLTFGSRLSTSGHLMPRHFLVSLAGIEPEDHFGEVRYSGAHDRTIYQTLAGEVDVGAVNGEIFRTMQRDGRIVGDDLHVIWETPPYPDYVWAINTTVPEDLQTRMRDAFLMLEAGNDDDAQILSAMGSRGFLPAGMAEFAPLKRIAESSGMLRSDR